MCGRYASSKEPAVLVEEFDVTVPPRVDLAPDYNVAPTKQVYAVLDRTLGGEQQRLLADVRWGLVPSWAKDRAVGNRLINARVETAASKPSFRAAWARRRAILPADGYYEWYTPEADPADARGKPKKQPYFIHRRDGATLAMAGLYELWRDPAVADPDAPGAWLWTACVLTTSATDRLGRIHDRMPIAVAPEAWSDWLDPSFAGDPHQLLDPAATADELEAYPVATLVNSVRNNGPELLRPL
ncbi:MAG: SOS response-associated peptidase [Actinobacteria bacterium]|nr:SOS response-associated peptidase [Actinomycetota bacterium]